MTVATASSNIWKNRAFQLLVATTWFQGLGSKIYALALPLIVYELTQSSEWMGWMRAVEFLPNLLLALFIGVWVDRFDRKRWALSMLVLQVVLFAVTFYLIQQSFYSVWLLFPIAFLVNACNYGFGNAKMGIMKHLFSHDQQGIVLARISGVRNFFDALGPTISGALLLMAAFYWPMAWVGILFLAAAITFKQLPWTKEAPRHNSGESVFTSLKQGWLALKSNQPMMIIAWMVVVINTTAGVFDIQAIYASKAVLNLNALQIGFMLSTAGIAALLGSIVAPYVRKRFNLGKTFLVTVALEGLCFALPVWELSVVTLTASLALSGFVGVIASVCIWTYRQESTPAEYLGRVAGITGSIFKLGLPFGLAASGYFVTAFGIEPLFAVCAVFQIAAVIVVMTTSVRKLV